MKKVVKIGTGICCLALILVGCAQNEKTLESRNYSVYGDTIKIQQESWTKQMDLATVQPFTYQKQIITAGDVLPIPNLYANIASPFAGRIVKSHVSLGELVKKGTPLFDIICPDFTSAQKDYFQALSTYEFSKNNYNRIHDLSINGVSSQKELEEAETSVIIAEKELENARTALQVYQVEDLVNMKLGQPLVVYSPIAGELIEDNIISGQYIKDDADPIAVVSDLSKIWVSAQVKEKDIQHIQEGDTMQIDVIAYPNLKLRGTVYHIEEALDQDTRSIRVLSVCNNIDEKIKIGMYVTVHFNCVPTQMTLIPATALLQDINSNYVFVEVAPHTYVKRAVQVETTVPEGAIINKGLQVGEKIIAKGGYLLKL